VTLDDSVPDAMVRDMVEDSYDLIVAAMPRAARERLGWKACA
jgi:predicted DNA-binding protein (MmcQ/YjbR family)